jgi:hypothetical protein
LGGFIVHRGAIELGSRKIYRYSPGMPLLPRRQDKFPIDHCEISA